MTRGIVFLMITLLLGGAALTGCATVAKSLGGVWYKPELAVTASEDAAGEALMSRYKDQIVLYLQSFGSEANIKSHAFNPLDNNLVEAGTKFVKFRDAEYLQISIKRDVTYNTGQAAGLVDTPRKRAEQDLHDCVLPMLKLYPQGLLTADYSGLVIATTHDYMDMTAELKLRKQENTQFIFTNELLRGFQNLELSIGQLLEQAVIIVDGSRV